MIICDINSETEISYPSFMLFNCLAGEIDAFIECAARHSKFSLISKDPMELVGLCHCILVEQSQTQSHTEWMNHRIKAGKGH